MNAAHENVEGSGDFEDVITFFGISKREGRRWTTRGDRGVPPRLAHWRKGRHLVFGEEAVVELRAKGYVASRRMSPGEARDIATREWRQHLQARRASAGHTSAPDEVAQLARRVERIERLLNQLVPGATEAAA